MDFCDFLNERLRATCEEEHIIRSFVVVVVVCVCVLGEAIFFDFCLFKKVNSQLQKNECVYFCETRAFFQQREYSSCIFLSIRKGKKPQTLLILDFKGEYHAIDVNTQQSALRSR